MSKDTTYDVHDRQKKKQFNIVLFGYPGCGKTTIAKKLTSEYKQFRTVASGELLRKHVQDCTALGVEIEEQMNSGNIISSISIIDVIVSYLEELQDSCRDSDCFYLFDGCPRTVQEADLLREHVSIDAVFHLDVPRDVVIQRLQHRYIHAASGRTYSDEYEPPKVAGLDDVTHEKLVQRIDDQPEAVVKRLSVFDQKTLPLLEYYRNLNILHSFHGTDSDLLYAQISSVVSDLLKGIHHEI